MNEVKYNFDFGSTFSSVMIPYLLAAGSMWVLVLVLKRLKNPLLVAQRGKISRRQFIRECFSSVQTALVFAIFGYVILNLRKAEYFQFFPAWEDSSIDLFYNSFVFLLLFFIHDTYFYWTHRILHSKFAISKIHRMHHKSIHTTPTTAYTFSFWEAVVQSAWVIPTLFIFPVYYSTFALFVFMQALFNIGGHSGVELFPAKFRYGYIGRWISNTTYHSRHHNKDYGCNYGLWFTWWDWAMGTMERDYYAKAFGDRENKGKLEKSLEA